MGIFVADQVNSSSLRRFRIIQKGKAETKCLSAGMFLSTGITEVADTAFGAVKFDREG